MKAVRLLACLFLIVMGLDAARVVAQQSNDTSSGPPPVTDPVAKELERCQRLSDQGASDPNCQAASKEATRRFFQPPGEYKPVPIQMNPDTPAPKLVKPDPAQSK